MQAGFAVILLSFCAGLALPVPVDRSDQGREDRTLSEDELTAELTDIENRIEAVRAQVKEPPEEVRHEKATEMSPSPTPGKNVEPTEFTSKPGEMHEVVVEKITPPSTQPNIEPTKTEIAPSPETSVSKKQNKEREPGKTVSPEKVEILSGHEVFKTNSSVEKLEENENKNMEGNVPSQISSENIANNQVSNDEDMDLAAEGDKSIPRISVKKISLENENVQAGTDNGVRKENLNRVPKVTVEKMTVKEEELKDKANELEQKTLLTVTNDEEENEEEDLESDGKESTETKVNQVTLKVTEQKERKPVPIQGSVEALANDEGDDEEEDLERVGAGEEENIEIAKQEKTQNNMVNLNMAEKLQDSSIPKVTVEKLDRNKNESEVEQSKGTDKTSLNVLVTKEKNEKSKPQEFTVVVERKEGNAEKAFETNGKEAEKKVTVTVEKVKNSPQGEAIERKGSQIRQQESSEDKVLEEEKLKETEGKATITVEKVKSAPQEDAPESKRNQIPQDNSEEYDLEQKELKEITQHDKTEQITVTVEKRQPEEEELEETERKATISVEKVKITPQEEASESKRNQIPQDNSEETDLEEEELKKITQHDKTEQITVRVEKREPEVLSDEPKDASSNLLLKSQGTKDLNPEKTGKTISSEEEDLMHNGEKKTEAQNHLKDVSRSGVILEDTSLRTENQQEDEERFEDELEQQQETAEEKKVALEFDKALQEERSKTKMTNVMSPTQLAETVKLSKSSTEELVKTTESPKESKAQTNAPEKESKGKMSLEELELAELSESVLNDDDNEINPQETTKAVPVSKSTENTITVAEARKATELTSTKSPTTVAAEPDKIVVKVEKVTVEVVSVDKEEGDYLSSKKETQQKEKAPTEEVVIKVKPEASISKSPSVLAKNANVTAPPSTKPATGKIQKKPMLNKDRNITEVQLQREQEDELETEAK
ncbi:enolase-phosphatase E1-like [Montipora foliosa]|uniref:enolase-phosphatase E1-like n=1 Tax=Montipora foliosa TaxID=591990 RepID=UPI0035F1A019